jgi:Rrf2 family transcriptional regulator, cysteine metabolism repressor
MRISAKGRYALAALMQIANKNDVAEPVSVISISEALGVSKLFLEQVVTALKKGGLITAVKGAKGGYQLSRYPSEITAMDVLKSVENALFETSQNEMLEQAPIVSNALSTLIFTPLDKSIENCLSGVTLRDLLDYVLEHGDNQSFMLYI